MKIQTILCPIDFSEPSDQALGSAIELATTFGAKVKAVHVFQRPISIALEGAPVTMGAAEEFIKQAHESLRKSLKDLEQQWKEKGVELETELIEGIPYAAIVDAASKCDMVVMSTHGRTGFQRFVLGSVAERVVRTSPVPVLTMPQEA